MKKLISRLVQTLVWLTTTASLGLACGSTDSVDQQNAQDAAEGTGGASPTGGGTIDGAAGTNNASGGSSATGGSSGTGGLVGAGGSAGAPHQDASVSMPPADAPFACGPETCAADEWCQYPCCGTLPPCMPNDGGTCAIGFKECSTIQNVQGCQYSCTIPSCSKQPPPSGLGCKIMGREVRCMCA